jgi:FtsP/CotA-like multicopper oxidase with cupredoxin domain
MMRLLRLAVLQGAIALVLGLLAWISWLWYDSRLPATYSVTSYGAVDFGGGAASAGGHDHSGGRSVADLRGPGGAPDERFTLSAMHAKVRLSSGRLVDALTFNGGVPGPELRVRQGDLVEVTLRNKDVEDGVTIHWHGVDVPNGEDGVAGVTQDAVPPGGSFTYRFRASQRGTFWYHTHQSSSREVRRGLYGAFVIEPRPRRSAELDLTLVAHTLDGYPILNTNDGVERRPVRAGEAVRLRLVNSDSTTHRFSLGGTPFRVLALDGTDLNGPTPLANTALEVAAGGRVDVGFTMPSSPVRLAMEGAGVGLALSRDGRALPPATTFDRTFDPIAYGRPAPTPFDADSAFDRRFNLTITRKPGFLDGRPGLQWALNGKIYPDVPMFVVRRGDLVEMTVANHTGSTHPMHLHGHHLLVLSRNGIAVSGSPWSVDTLDVKGHETYDVAFLADNPGMWMDHCHNLVHAANGLTLHVAYAGISTPFRVGDGPHNQPE